MPLTKVENSVIKNEKGAAMIELACWLPLFFLMMTAMFFCYETILKAVHVENAAMASVLSKAAGTNEFGPVFSASMKKDVKLPFKVQEILGLKPVEVKRTIFLYNGSYPRNGRSYYHHGQTTRRKVWEQAP